MTSPRSSIRILAGGARRRIGMPRALLHYRYGTLWTTFFEELGCEVVVSDPTDRSIVARGDALSNDECCLASKIYLGHVASLVDADRCDAVFVPSVANVGRRRGFCTKFQALPDLVANTFADKRIELVSCLVNEVDERKGMKGALTISFVGKQHHGVHALEHVHQCTAHERIVCEVGVGCQQNT